MAAIFGLVDCESTPPDLDADAGSWVGNRRDMLGGL